MSTPLSSLPPEQADLAALRVENTQLRQELSAFHRTNVELASCIAAILAGCYQDDLEEAVAAKLVPDDEPCETPASNASATAARPEEGASEEAAEADPADPVDPFEDFTTTLLLGLFRHLSELRLMGYTPHGVALGLSSSAPGSPAQLGFLMHVAEGAPLTRGGLLDDLFRAVLKLRADHPDVFDAGAGSPTVLSPDHPAYEQLLQIAKEHNIALPSLPGPSAEEAP